MSEMFAVRVASVGKESAKLAVRSVHPDSGPPQPTSTFALMLLYDPIINSGYSDFEAFDHLESSPLAQEMDKEAYLDPEWITEHANAFVARAKVSKGVLEVWPTDPAWISHLRSGMSWDTAAYSNGDGKPADPRIPTPPSEDGSPQRSRDPAEGFRVGPPKDEEYKIAEAFIPLFGASRYVADPVLADEKAIRDAVPGLIGQPLLMIPKRGPSEIGVLVNVYPDAIFLYYESSGGWGGSSTDFTKIKSIGRAWLKPKAIPTIAPPKKKAAGPAKLKAKLKSRAPKAKTKVLKAKTRSKSPAKAKARARR